MADEPLSYADQVIREAMLAVSGGVDLGVAGNAVQSALEALDEQVKVLKDANYEECDVRTSCPKCGKFIKVLIPRVAPVEVARAASHTAKVIDGVARLMAFCKGQPDSRPDSGAEFLKYMTEGEIAAVQARIAAARAAERARVP